MYGDATPDITEFFHGGNDVYWADRVVTQAAVDIDTVWTDIGALRIPAYTKLGLASFTGDTASAYWQWRTNGQTGDVGHKIGYLTPNAAGQYNAQHTLVITDSSQVLEMKADASNTAKIVVFTEGWKFPVGI